MPAGFSQKKTKRFWGLLPFSRKGRSDVILVLFCSLQSWNLTLGFGSADTNAGVLTATAFWRRRSFRRYVATCANVLCSLSLVCRHRESIISNQMFRNNYCHLFTSFLPLFTCATTFFFSLISFAREAIQALYYQPTGSITFL